MSCKDKIEEEIFDNFIKVTSENVKAGFEEKIIEIGVESNCDWNITKLNEDGNLATWIKTDKIKGKGSSTFNIKILKNPTGEPRTGTVDIKGENASAFITIEQEANPNPDTDPEIPDNPDVPETPEFYEMPVYEMFDNGGILDVESGKIVTDTPNFTNATVDGNIITFSNGLVIEKQGTPGNILMACPSHTNPKKYAGFQLGICADFLPGEAWIYKIPMKNELFGELKFSYGSRKEGIENASAYKWSSDEGATWNDIEEMKPIKSDAAFKSIWFTIPQDKKVEAEKSLWIKVEQSAAIVYIQNGITLDYAEAPKSDIPQQNSTSVIISEGYDATTRTNAAHIEVPGFMKSNASGYTSSKGDFFDDESVLENPFISYEHCSARPGYVQVGFSDEAVVGRSGFNGTVKIAVGERLKEMNIEKTNIKLSFKAAIITTAYNVTNDARIIVKNGINTVAEVRNPSIDRFGDYLFTINDIDQQTELVITSISDIDKPKEGASSHNGRPTIAKDLADFRFFIDDLLIETTSESKPEEPQEKRLTFDFSTCPAGWPTTDKREHVLGGVKCNYNLDGTNYEFVLADATDATSDRVYWNKNGYLIWASFYRYLGLPAIEGYKLTKIECLHATSTKEGRKMGVATAIVEADESKVSYTPGGDPIEFSNNGETYTFNLSDTESNTVYYLYCSALGVGVSELTLTYKQ